MYRVKIQASAVAAVVLVMLATFWASAFAISLCSYRPPETSLLDAGLSLAYQYYDDANTPAIDVSSGAIDFAFDCLRDSELFGFTARLDGHVGLVGLLPATWLGEGATSFRYYVSKDGPLFGFGGLRAIAATGQTQLGLEIRSGFGLGRFHDVSPLAKAMTIHKKLLASTAIRAGLSDAVVLEIAQAIEGFSTTRNVGNTVAAIESSIEAAVGVQLDARSLLMIEDIATGTEPQRFCGVSAQAGLGYELLDPYGGSPGFVVALSSDLAYAPDPGGQLEGHMSFSGPFDLANENTLTGSFSYEILISAESAIEAAYSFQRVKPSGLAPVTTHGVECNLLFAVASIDVLFGTTASRSTGDAGWSVSLSISAAMDLL